MNGFGSKTVFLAPRTRIRSHWSCKDFDFFSGVTHVLRKEDVCVCVCVCVLRDFWNGNHAIPMQRGLVFTKIIIP